jgi:hypothetical protein
MVRGNRNDPGSGSSTGEGGENAGASGGVDSANGSGSSNAELEDDIFMNADGPVNDVERTRRSRLRKMWLEPVSKSIYIVCYLVYGMCV